MQLSTAAACLDKKIRTRIQNHNTAEVHLPFSCEAFVGQRWNDCWFHTKPHEHLSFVLTGNGNNQTSFPGQRFRLLRLWWKHDTVDTLARMFCPSVSVQRSTWTLLHLRWVWKTNSSKRSKKEKKRVTSVTLWVASMLLPVSCFLALQWYRTWQTRKKQKDKLF